MGSARAVFIENGPNADGAYLNIDKGAVKVRSSDAEQARQDRIEALLEAILAELRRIK